MIGVIVNPNSRKNRRDPRRRQRISESLGAAGRVIATSGIEEVAHALRTFAEEERRFVIADGGDGALHWVVNEAVRLWGESEAREKFTYIPGAGGSVDFVAMALGLRGPVDRIIERLVVRLGSGGAPELVDVPSVRMVGVSRDEGGHTHFERIGFGNALAGYGANFFGPLYESGFDRGAVTISANVAAAFGSAATRALFVGPLDRLKPRAIAKAEHDYLRPLLADVEIDGRLLSDGRGRPVREHTAVHVASIPLNLSGVFRVFPKAGEGVLHVHAGYVSALEMAVIMPFLVTGQSFNPLLPRAYDGEARSLRVVCHDGVTMDPVLDGELFRGLVELTATPGPTFRMAVI